MVPGVNIISGKASVANVNGAGGFGGALWAPQRGFRKLGPLRKFLGSNKHLDWLKIDLNATKIITVKD